MLTLLSENFVLEDVTRYDIIIASLAWGFTLGIGWLTVWAAIKQTQGIIKRRGWDTFRNAYFWMMWLEIIVCLAFGVMCYMYLLGLIPPSFAFYFCILTLWALQVQFLLQIIINRCAILITDHRFTFRLKVAVAVLITAINISVYCIWIPARLQISDMYVHVNEYWDRTEKIIYLIVDAALNFYFIRIVQQNLVKHGLNKYKGVVRFNMFIIMFSLAMDVLIISMMSLKNTFVYMQFHPLAYIVKLKIELSMAELIAKIAKNRDSNQRNGSEPDYYGRSRSDRTRNIISGDEAEGNGSNGNSNPNTRNKAWATVTTTLEMKTMDREGREIKKGGSHESDTDSLIDPVSAFATGGTGTGPVQREREGGSMSSYNTYSESPSALKQDT